MLYLCLMTYILTGYIGVSTLAVKKNVWPKNNFWTPPKPTVEYLTTPLAIISIWPLLDSFESSVDH